MTYFYNDVNEWLSTGGDLDLAKDLTGSDFTTTVMLLRDHGVTHVLDVRSEWNDKDAWITGGLSPENYVHAPIIDSRSHSPAEGWYTAVEDFVLRFWLESNEGDRLYVHCHMGINRGTSAAMLALLVTDPLLSPFDAFLAIREARPAAGLVYAEAVGARHIAQSVEDYVDRCMALGEFRQEMNDYWTPELEMAVRKGIAYYRSAEGGTVVVKGLTDAMS